MTPKATYDLRPCAYDQAGNLLGEYSGTGALIQETIWLGDTPVATLRPNGTSVAIYYVETDQLDTPRAVISPSNNAVRWTWYVRPFGNFAPNQNPQSLGTFVYDLRFPGQIAGSWGSTFQNGWRDFDPAVDRYVESDPLGLKAGVNTYAYVGSDPIMSSDPSGLLVRGNGWSNQQWNDIEKAEAKIRKQLEKCSCPKGGSCVPCDLAPTLLNRLDTMIVAYAPLASDCGWTPPTTPRSLQEEFAMIKLLRILSVSIVAVLMPLLSPELFAKTTAITLAELVQQSPVIILGHIDDENHFTRPNSRWVSFKPSKIIRGGASLAGHDIKLCNSPPPMREYPELSKMTGDALLFLSAEKDGCFEFSHTTTSVVQVRDGRATTAAIADQPIYQPWGGILAEAS